MPDYTDKAAEYWPDWLLDAVAGATQDRSFLRGEPEYDDIAGEAILRNGQKAIKNVLANVADLVVAFEPGHHGREWRECLADRIRAGELTLTKQDQRTFRAEPTTLSVAKAWQEKIARDHWEAGAKLAVDEIVAGRRPNAQKPYGDGA